MASDTTKSLSLPERLGLIQLDLAAERKLKETLVEWMDYWLCGREMNVEAVGGKCLPPHEVDGRINRILADHYVDNVEAPKLFELLTTVSGKDKSLTETEISIKRFRDALVQSKGEEPLPEPEDAIQEFAQEIAKAMDKLKAEDELFRMDEIASIPALLMPDKENYKRVFLNLDLNEERLDRTIALLEQKKNELFEESLSFWNFYMSAANAWGLAAYFTPDGAPPSNIELEGVRRVIRILRELKTGLQSFQRQVKAKKLNLNDPDVKKLMNSPIIEAAHIPCVFGYKVEHGDVDNLWSPILFYNWVIQTLCENDATGTAIELVDFYAEEVGEGHQGRIEAALSGALLYRFMQFGDALASPDSVGLGGAGGLAARGIQVLTKMAKGTEFVAANFHHLDKFRKFSRLLPGSSLIRTGEEAGKTTRVCAVGVNMLAELAKFEASRFLARQTGIDGLEGVVGGTYMFFGGFVSTLEAGLPLKIANDLLANRNSEVVDRILAKGLGENEMARLADEISLASQRTLRLSKRDAGEILNALTKRKRELELAAKQVRQEIGRIADQIRRLINKNRAVLSEELVDEVNEIARSTDHATAARRLEEILKDAQGEVRKAREATRQTAANAPKRGLKVVRSEGGATPAERAVENGRGERLATPRDEKPKTPEPKPTTIQTPQLDAAISAPPARLSGRLVSKMTQGRVRVSRKVQRRLARRYREGPDIRAPFWRVVRDNMVLGQKNEVIKDYAMTDALGKTILRTKVGIHFRVFFRHIDDGVIEIVEFLPRESLN